MSARDRGHDRCIGHSKTVKTAHAQARVDHGHEIAAHFARSHGVIDRLPFGAHAGAQISVRRRRCSRDNLPAIEQRKRRCGRNPSGNFQSFDYRRKIVPSRIGKMVHPNDGTSSGFRDFNVTRPRLRGCSSMLARVKPCSCGGVRPSSNQSTGRKIISMSGAAKSGRVRMNAKASPPFELNMPRRKRK